MSSSDPISAALQTCGLVLRDWFFNDYEEVVKAQVDHHQQQVCDVEELLHATDPQSIIDQHRVSQDTGHHNDEAVDPTYSPEDAAGTTTGEQQQQQENHFDASELLPEALTVDFKKELQTLTNNNTDPNDLVDNVSRLLRYILSLNMALDTKGWTNPLNSVSKSLEDKHRATLAGFYDYDDDDDKAHNAAVRGDNPIVGDGLYTDKMGCVSCSGIAKTVCRDCFSIRKCHRCFVEEGCGYRMSEFSEACRNVNNRSHIAYRGKQFASTVKFAYMQAYAGPYGWVNYFSTRPLAVITAHHLKLHLKGELKKGYTGSSDNAQYSRSTLYSKPPLLTNYWSTQKLICRAQGCKNFANFVQNVIIAPPKKKTTMAGGGDEEEEIEVEGRTTIPRRGRKRKCKKDDKSGTGRDSKKNKNIDDDDDDDDDGDDDVDVGEKVILTKRDKGRGPDLDYEKTTATLECIYCWQCAQKDPDIYAKGLSFGKFIYVDPHYPKWRGVSYFNDLVMAPRSR